MILSIIYPTSKLIPPIKPNFRKSPKLILLDTGLINFFAKYQNEILKKTDISNVHNGLVAEHIVAQELRTYNKNFLHKIHFWVREKKNQMLKWILFTPLKIYSSLLKLKQVKPEG